MSREIQVWEGSPSQLINLKSYAFLLLTSFLIFPIFIIIWKFLVTKLTKYNLTDRRLKTSTGVLNKKIDNIELVRIRDYSIEKPLFLRLFSLGNIILETTDRSHPTFVLCAVAYSGQNEHLLRKA